VSRTIHHEFHLPQPPEVVWQYLTEPALLAQWLMPNDIFPEPGHQFTFRAKPIPKFGFDGIIKCEILEVIPHQRLIYSWKGGGKKEHPLLDTIVEWTLLPIAENTTLLRLEHKGFKGLKNLLPYVIMKSGWAKIGKRFIHCLNALEK